MDAALELKFTQDEGLKKMLLSTGDAQLVEVGPFPPSSYTLPSHGDRTLPTMRFGVWGRSGTGEMNLARPWKDCGPRYGQSVLLYCSTNNIFHIMASPIFLRIPSGMTVKCIRLLNIFFKL